MTPNFLNILAGAVKHKVSDVHLHIGASPGFRIKGDVIDVKLPPLAADEMHAIVSGLIKSTGMQADPNTVKDFDGSFEIKGLARFRFNVFRNRSGLGIVLRVIPSVVPTIEQLGLPGVLKSISGMHRGLVLVTGVTGSGKSSTLAAMIDYLNSTWPLHILTIEDPVEFVHRKKKSRFTQREVGPDTESFAGALKSALRQDPDIILVGEMRDAETIGIALKAAETGHMVFSTVHTTDAIKTIGRLIAVFPPEEQRMIRMRLAENITATISQRLVKRADGKGMVAAQEIMIANTGIRECIADPQLTGQINEFIAKSYDAPEGGGQTFEQHLVKLYYDGVIDLDAAKEAASNAQDLERNLTYAAPEGGSARVPKFDAAGISLETDDDRTKHTEALTAATASALAEKKAASAAKEAAARETESAGAPTQEREPETSTQIGFRPDLSMRTDDPSIQIDGELLEPTDSGESTSTSTGAIAPPKRLTPPKRAA